MNPKEQVQREEAVRQCQQLKRRFARMAEEAGEDVDTPPHVWLPGWPTEEDVPVDPDWDELEAEFRAIEVVRIPEGDLQGLQQRVGGVCLAVLNAIPDNITSEQTERILATLDRLTDSLKRRMDPGTVQ